jgi:hypothetical protein
MYIILNEYVFKFFDLCLWLRNLNLFSANFFKKNKNSFCSKVFSKNKKVLQKNSLQKIKINRRIFIIFIMKNNRL